MGPGILQAASRMAAAFWSTSWPPWRRDQAICILCLGHGFRETSLHLVTVSQAEFRARCRAYRTPGWSLAGFSLRTLKEGPVGEKKQTGWTSLVNDPLSMAGPTMAAHSPASLQGPLSIRLTPATAHRKREQLSGWGRVGVGAAGQESLVKSK